MNIKKSLIKSHFNHTVKLIDLLIVLFSGVFTHWIRFSSLNIPANTLWEIIISGIILVFIFNKNGLYSTFRGLNIKSILYNITKYWILWILIICLFAFLTKTGESISRLWLISFSFSVLILIIIQRIIIQKTLIWMRSKGLNQKNILFIGSEAEHKSLKTHLSSQTWSGFKINAFLNTKSPILSNSQEINNHLKSKKISEIWIGLSVQTNKTKSNYLEALKTSCLQIRLIPMLMESNLNLLNHSITEVANLPVINLRISPLFGFNKIIKYLEDKILSFLILLLISPLMLVIAVIIKLTSKGPIFYKQERLSWQGNSFYILKFRSMPVNSEKKSGAIWAKKQDNRATKFGAFLRKTSLDELPQFINVLKGDMSIVGPRPERPVFVDKFKAEIPGYMHKHLIKAGITGWAQINGWRGNTDLKKRIEHDLYYIDNWSLMLDLKIIFLTVFKVFYNKNAY